MPEMQEHHPVPKQRPDSEGPDSLAVQGVLEGDTPTGAGDTPTRHEDEKGWAIPSDNRPQPQPEEASCWRDGQTLFYNHICYPTMNGRIVDFRDGPRNTRKTRVAVVSDPIRGSTIWHYAKCSCDAGFHWGAPCAHKAAAFWLIRIKGNLPVGFPKF